MYDYKQTIVKSKTEDVQVVSPREIDFIGEVDEKNTKHIIDFLCMCEANDKKILEQNANKLPNAQTPLEPIKINITSFGGSVDLGLAIIDKLESMVAPIHTHVNGCAYSMAFILYLKGEIRTAGRFARFMNHGSSGYTWGYLPESQAVLDNGKAKDALCEEIILNACDYPMEKIVEDRNKCNFFGYKEALEYGIINVDLFAPVEEDTTLDVTDADEFLSTEEFNKVEHLEGATDESFETEFEDD